MKKNFIFKRVLTLVLAVMMLVTAMPVGVLADPGTAGAQDDKYLADDYSITYNDKIIRKADYINKVENLPIEPVKTKNGKTAEDLIKNPAQPERYTVRADFKVERGDDYVISYQPYIATVGAAASDEEKKKVNKELNFPVFDGYTSATKKTTVDYKFVKERADKGKEKKDPDLGVEKKGPYEAIYKPIESSVLVKHVFQSFDKPEVYGEKLDDPKDYFRETTQTGLTGTSLKIQPLPDNEIEGYVPESNDIKTQVPENPKGFVVEFRYNRASYDLIYDTDGGTPIPSRRVYYKQVIPKLSGNEIPSKEGCDFLGWKPSHDIEDKNGKKFKAGEIIAVGTGQAIKNLDANLLVPALKAKNNNRPAEKLIFTAVWKDKEKADYAVQFWAEKADHDDNATTAQKYEYMGTRVYKDVNTGTRPDLATEPVKDIVFPDLDQARLKKIWANVRFNRGRDLYLNKFFVYNQALTADQNKDPKKVNLVKAVNANGKTVYNIYYDRQVYDLYFTKSNALPAENTFYPEIWGYDESQGEIVKKGGPGNPYHYKARFNQLMLGWPNDAMQTKGFSEGMQSFGWGPNYSSPNFPTHLDTPPYRLNADEFLDMEKYDTWGGYTKKIDKGDGTSIDLMWYDYKILSFGIKQDKGSMPHHMDFWMDGFKDDETIIRYDLYRYKADTNSDTYSPKYPKVQGFTGKSTNETPEFLDSDGIDEKNDERADVTPFPAKTYTDMYGERPVGMMKFIKAFLNNGDEWGDPDGWDGFDKNGYLKFEYTRNKYPLRFNYDPSKIKDDSEFDSTNQLDTFYEFPLKALSPDLEGNEEYKKDNPANLLDNPENLQKLGLTDLVFKDTDGKLKVKRPEGLSPQMVFKGWALDPAGSKLVLGSKGETMPSHPVNLYAKWGEPDYKWKVTFDPNGGKMPDLKPKTITSEEKTIREGDIGFEREVTYPLAGYKNQDGTKIEPTVDGKKIFTVIQRQKLVPPEIPTRKGYEFMGWELVRYKKDDKGNLKLDQNNKPIEDTSYWKEFDVPELYSFDNDVVSDLYLRAIWNKNDLIDIKVYHHFLDKDYKEESMQEQVLQNRRVGSYVGAVGSRQDASRILVPKDEWEKLEKNNSTKLKDSMTYAQYMALDKDHPRVNSYSQQIRIGQEKIQDPAYPNDPNKLIDNPLNQFHFYYRPFRQREYKVNYLDERGRKEVEKFIEDSKKAFKDIKDSTTLDDKGKIDAYKKLLEKNRTKFEAIRKKYAIIDQEAVKNGKRHFDARNYRPIAGWVLDDKPQQQLFFDIDEDTNAFFGINETGLDEINFFYKDVRVVEVKKDDPVPDGYVRVTFKAADGGVFNTKHKNPVEKQEGEKNYQEFITEEKSELYYDVAKGLRSQLLPVPGNPIEENKKEADKYYITPDNGKRFIEWDKKKLLNDNTVIEQDYTFTAQYDWSGVAAKPMVRTEANKDEPYVNNFAPTIDELKTQIVWMVDGKEKALPADAKVYIEGTIKEETDPSGNKTKTIVEKTPDEINKIIYDKVKELNKFDKDELVRTVNIKALVKFKDEKDIKELEIPVTIYKNVYEALTNGDMPKVLKDATTAPDGDLVNVTGKYVKVTVQPTNKPSNKDAKIYYVNPNAWVNISEVDISKDASSLGFTKWTADKKDQNENKEENGVFDFGKRHMFTEDTVITPNFSDDVKEQKDGEPKPDVPNDFVKVIVEKTEKAELKTGEAQTQTFWVNPTKVVTIPVNKPTGKTEAAAAGEQAKAWIFEKWISDEAPARTWNDTITAQFREPETTITANYKQADNIIKYDPEEPITKPEGYVRVKFEADEGLTLKNVQYYYVKKNSGVKLSDLTYPDHDKKTGYDFNKWDKDKNTEIFSDNITVKALSTKLKNVVPDDGNPNTKPKGYVEVVFVIKAEDAAKGSIDGVAKFYVKPNEYVKIDPPATKANTGFEFGAWEKDATIPTVYDKDTTITGSFNELDAVIPKKNPNGSENEQPAGYKTVTFVIDPTTGGKIKDGEATVYYVNPAKEVTVPQPKTQAETGYVFEKWDKDTTTATKYTDDTTVKGNFKKLDDIIPSKDNNGNKNAQPEGYVTVTFTKGAHGSSISGETVYYVNPTANKTLANITTKPTVIPDTGYAVNGWDEDDDFTITEDITVNAKFDNFGDVIPEKDEHGNPNMIPFNYVKVTFDTTSNGTIENSTETTKVVFVKPNTAVALKGYEPKVEAKAGYDFTSWDVDLTLPTVYNSPRTITAQYNSLGDIKTKPENGYVKVVFKTDETKGTLQGDTVLWVAPNKEVNIPAPVVTPRAGHKFTGWDQKLTVNLPTDLPTGSDIYEINAQYSDDKNIILKTKEDDSEKPKGYVKVTFRADDNGKLVGDKDVITYFVNPNAGIKLVELEDGRTATATQLAVPKTIADENYKFEKWYESLDTANPIMTDQEYVARFNKGKVTLTYEPGEGEGTLPIPVIVDYGTKVTLAPATNISKADASFKGWKLDGDETIYQPGDEVKLEKARTATAQWTTDKDIISYDPVKDPTTRPDDTYVRVTFEADNGLSLTEQKAYYVKKNAGVKFGDIKNDKTNYGYPSYKEETGYKFDKWDKADTDTITTDVLVTAKAEKLDKVIPEKEDGTPNEKPDGYKEVTFVIKTEDKAKGSLEGVTKFYVNPTEYVTINPPTTEANTGFEFGAWSPDPSIPTVYKEDKTIEASFNGLKDVIPKTKTDESEKPDGYVTVTFEIEGKGGSIAPKETTVYYVKPNTKVTINPPKTIAKTGYKFNGWDIITKDVSFDKDKTIKGSFTQLKDIIPAEENGTTNAQPDGYIKVTFDKGDHGKEITGQTVYYVNPEAGKTIGDTEIAKPTVTPETGWKQKTAADAWNTLDTTPIKGQEDIVVKAQYDSIDDVIVKTADNDSQKPEGYITVTFDTVDSGKGVIGSTIITKKVLFVNPNKAVKLTDYAPTVNTKTGYKFARWDTSIERAIQYKDNDTIKALYNDPENISTTEVYGYVKVEFKPGTNGSLEGQTEYWIKPGVQVNIPEPKVDPNVGFKFKKWDRSLTVTAKANDPTYEITAEYEELANIIPQKNTDESDKPKGYVTIKFEAVHGTLKGTLVYYVNPNKDIMLLSTGESIIDKADTGYTDSHGTWSETVSDLKKYTEDKTITYTFKKLDNVIPEKNPTTGKANEQPTGYKKVTLIPTDKAKDEPKENKENKVYFVNPLKNVTLPEFKPTGKEDRDASGNKFTYVFNVWTSIKGVYGVWSNPNGKIEGIFTQDTDIEARYTKTEDLAPIAKKGAITQINVVPNAKDLIANVHDPKNPENKDNLPDGTTFEYTTDGKPDVSKLGSTTAKVKVTYKNGNTVTVEVPITVVKSVDGIEYNPEDVIPFNPTDLDNPNNPIKRPEGFIKVTFEADAGIRLTEPKAYYVRKKALDKKGNPLKLSALQKPSYELAQGYGFGNWDDDTITIGESDIVVRARANRVVKPDDKPSYPEVIYRDKIVEKEKIVEKIVKVGENDELLKEIRYMQGFNGKFRPYDGLTRAEAAQILANALKADGYRYDANYALSYSDVGNKWYTDAVRVVTQAGVFQGYSDGTFRPQGKITRAEWVATLRRFQDLKEASGNTMMLRSNHWATAEVEAAYEAGWLGVYQNGIAKFDADKPITRQEVAYVSNRAFRRVLDKVYLKRSVNTLLTYKDINPSMPLYEDILCASNTLLTDNRYYKANTVVMDNLTFNIVTDYLRIQQKKFQYNVIR